MLLIKICIYVYKMLLYKSLYVQNKGFFNHQERKIKYTASVNDNILNATVTVVSFQ